MCHMCHHYAKTSDMIVISVIWAHSTAVWQIEKERGFLGAVQKDWYIQR